MNYLLIRVWACGFTDIMSAAANTSRRAEGEAGLAWHHLRHPLSVLQGEGPPLAGAVLITSVLKCQAGIYVSR